MPNYAENRFREVFEQAPVSMQLVSADGKTLQVNKAWERLWQGTFGDGLRELVLHGDYNLLTDPQLEAKGVTPYLRRAFNGETAVEIPAILYDPTELGIAARPRWVSAIAHPIKDQDGKVVELMLMHEDITDRVEAERELVAREERFRSLVTATSQVVWTSDPEGRIVSDSPSWHEFTGQGFAEFQGAGWLHAVHPDDREGVTAAWARSIASKAVFEHEFRVRRIDGQYRWIHARAVPILNQAGTVREWIGANSDITEKKLADEQLKISRLRVESALNAGDIGTWTWEIPQDRVYADQNLARIFGTSPADADGGSLQAYLAAIHPDDMARARETIYDAIASGDLHHLRYRVRNGQGGYAIVDARGKVEYDSQGRPLRLSGIVLDVTEQVQAEIRLQESEQARRQGEERYRTVVSSMDQAFCIIDMMYDAAGAPIDYRILEVNSVFEQQTGIINAVGKTIRELIPTHDERWSQIYGQVARTGESVRFQQESRNLGRWFDVYAARLGGDGSRQVAVILSDITDTRRKNAELQQLAEDLATANRRQAEFLATLAHELRNPLAPIRTGLDLLRIGADNPSILATARPMMERQVNHLIALVDDLLDLARINSGKIEIKKSRVQLKDIVLRAVEMTLPTVQAKHHDFALDVDEEPIWLDADPTRLAQVIGNLLTNAAKYTPQGGKIALSVKRNGTQAAVTVQDNGIGIPPESLPEIFTMFTQVGRGLEQEQGGLGIGLNLVKRLTEKHGGTVSAYSDGPGKGSIFTVRLPVEASAVESVPVDSTSAVRQHAPAAGLRILVADDNQDAAEMLKALLESDGHIVSVANDGNEALSIAQRFSPELALLDIGMPGMNGYELARALRDIPALRRMTLVALTGWGAHEDRAKSQEAGFDHHLTKPVDFESLRKVVNSGT